MFIKELVALAKARSGKSQLEMAAAMKHNGHTRLTNIAAGRLQPNASEIVYLAEAANLPPIQTLAEIESERHPELAFVWAKAGASLKQTIKSL